MRYFWNHLILESADDIDAKIAELDRQLGKGTISGDEYEAKLEALLGAQNKIDSVTTEDEAPKSEAPAESSEDDDISFLKNSELKLTAQDEAEIRNRAIATIKGQKFESNADRKAAFDKAYNAARSAYYKEKTSKREQRVADTAKKREDKAIVDEEYRQVKLQQRSKMQSLIDKLNNTGEIAGYYVINIIKDYAQTYSDLVLNSDAVELITVDGESIAINLDAASPDQLKAYGLNPDGSPRDKNRTVYTVRYNGINEPKKKKFASRTQVALPSDKVLKNDKVAADKINKEADSAASAVLTQLDRSKQENPDVSLPDKAELRKNSGFDEDSNTSSTWAFAPGIISSGSTTQAQLAKRFQGYLLSPNVKIVYEANFYNTLNKLVDDKASKLLSILKFDAHEQEVDFIDYSKTVEVNGVKKYARKLMPVSSAISGYRQLKEKYSDSIKNGEAKVAKLETKFDNEEAIETTKLALAAAQKKLNSVTAKLQELETMVKNNDVSTFFGTSLGANNKVESKIKHVRQSYIEKLHTILSDKAENDATAARLGVETDENSYNRGATGRAKSLLYMLCNITMKNPNAPKDVIQEVMVTFDPASKPGVTAKPSAEPVTVKESTSIYLEGLFV